MSFTTVVLVVESLESEFQRVPKWVGENCILFKVASPLQAIRAMHAVQFHMVIVAAKSVEDDDYLALFSTMRLVTPTALLMQL